MWGKEREKGGGIRESCSQPVPGIYKRIDLVIVSEGSGFRELLL